VNSHETLLYGNSFPVEGKTFKNAGYVSRQVKTLLQKMKFSKEVVRRAAIVTYEAEINICSYAERGKIDLKITPERIIIEAKDEGQGIGDIEMAMKEGFSTATEKILRMGFGAGLGLSNIKHFSDSFQITSVVGKGTHLKMTIRTQPPAMKSPP